jgi:hypothetical protein
MLYKLAAKCRGEEVDEEAEAVLGGSAKTKTTGSLDEAKDDGFRPAKLFSIDRVFRNETMDATHLAEFHQVEGVVADRELTLADLIGASTWAGSADDILMIFSGFMRVFFKKMGIEKVRFKPAYNPYTEVRLFSSQLSLTYFTLVSLLWKSSPSIPCSTGGLKLATAECSDRRCLSPWDSPKMSECMGGVFRWRGPQ